MDLTSKIHNDKGNSAIGGYLQAASTFWESPFRAALAAALIYFSIAYVSGKLVSATEVSYFNYLADAFLHGDLWFRSVPSDITDLILFQGRYTVYQSPFPAFVLMPWVAVFGVGLNDVVYTAIIASMNVGGLSLLLRVAARKQLIHLTEVQRSLLVLFFTVGTVHVTLAPIGRVWSTALTLGFTCVLLAYLAALSLDGAKAWFLTGFALTCAMLTRNHLVFTGIFPAIYLLTKEKPWSWRRVSRNLVFAALPILVGVAFLLLYNQVRFGSPFNNGLNYHLMNDFFRADFEKYGVFNLHYVPINLYYQFVYYPFPLGKDSLMGGSIFLLSPLFLAAIAAFWKPRVKWHVWTLLLTIAVTSIPILLLMGTGWAQFGPRYTLDYTVPLLLLTAIGMEKWKNWVVRVLIAVSAFHYLITIPFWVII